VSFDTSPRPARTLLRTNGCESIFSLSTRLRGKRVWGEGGVKLSCFRVNRRFAPLYLSVLAVIEDDDGLRLGEPMQDEGQADPGGTVAHLVQMARFDEADIMTNWLESNVKFTVAFVNNEQKLFVDVNTPQGRQLYEGMFTGETVYPALMAAQELGKSGLSCRVLSMHTIKPLDVDTVISAATECRAVVSVEEHSVFGGLGEACAAVLMQAGIHVPFKIVGFPDEYMVTGSQLEIFDHHGISAQGLARTAQRVLTDGD